MAPRSQQAVFSYLMAIDILIIQVRGRYRALTRPKNPVFPTRSFILQGISVTLFPNSKFGSLGFDRGKMTKPRSFVCLLLALVLCVTLAYGQAVSGTMVGTISDSSGASVPNAKITITEVNTGNIRTANTNESGNYNFADLPPGKYKVSIELTGFKREERSDVDVLVNTTRRIDMTLQPGAVSETVEVTGAPPMLQTDRADTSSSIETAQMANLPVGTQRNFQSFLNLVPGTTPASFQHSQFFNAASSLQTEVNGQMRQGNSYQIEGIDDNERTGLLQILVPPIEAIQTVDVSTSNFEAELGRASGANTNVILKSGSNQFHGGAYEFLRNNELNARNFFDTSLGHLSYNYFGGNIGGAIRKNKVAPVVKTTFAL